MPSNRYFGVFANITCQCFVSLEFFVNEVGVSVAASLFHGGFLNSTIYSKQTAGKVKDVTSCVSEDSSLERPTQRILKCFILLFLSALCIPSLISLVSVSEESLTSKGSTEKENLHLMKLTSSVNNHHWVCLSLLSS